MVKQIKQKQTSEMGNKSNQQLAPKFIILSLTH